MRHPRRQATVIALAIAAGSLSCRPAATSSTATAANAANALAASSPTALDNQLAQLVGGWRWHLRSEDHGSVRVEDEIWRLHLSPTSPEQLVGRYLRTVDVASTDGNPFGCNQRPRYRQRAMYDVVVALAPGGGFDVRETGYRTEPDPCDHGFRHLGGYHATLAGERATLRWTGSGAAGNGRGSAGGGEETLFRIDDAPTELPAVAWSTEVTPAGSWRWLATSYDDAGLVRDEVEWWEITRHNDRHLDATYRRRVTVHSPDGGAIACAGAPSWSFDDVYVLVGEREEEHWRLHEVAVDPGDHPCLRATPRRHLDEATAEQIGDAFVLEWRGKRKQILFRP